VSGEQIDIRLTVAEQDNILSTPEQIQSMYVTIYLHVNGCIRTNMDYKK